MPGEAVDIDAMFQPLVIKWRDREWNVNRGVPLSALTLAKGYEEFSPADPEHAAVLVAGLLNISLDELRGLDPTREELFAILWQVAQFFGMSPGESPASSTESDKPAGRSRPTSNDSTESTSSDAAL